MKLEERLAASLRELGVGPHDHLAVACSGGADSIALLHLASRVCDPIVVLHVDHQLRATSSDDAAFVERVANSLGLEFFSRVVHVSRNGSIEAAARAARYDALEDMARVARVTRVLTAHTLDDQAETVLLRLMRGSTLDAIAPMRGAFLRPLLGVRRDELRNFLVDNDIAWHEDETNTDLRFDRNWLRHSVLPLLEDRRRGTTEVIARTAASQRADNALLDELAAEVVAGCEADDVGVFVPAIDVLPRAIASRVVRMTLRKGDHDPSVADVEAVLALNKGRVRCGSVDVWRLDGGFAFVPNPTKVPAPVVLPDRGRLDASEWQLSVDVGEPTEARWRFHVPEGTECLAIRSRRPGDRVPTSGGTKKVQDVLVDAKVPRPLRGLVPILVASDEPLAVVGGRDAGSAISGRVVAVEPMSQTWSRERVWIR